METIIITLSQSQMFKSNNQKHYCIYAYIDLKLWNIHNMDVLQNWCYICIQWTPDIYMYSVVITR